MADTGQRSTDSDFDRSIPLSKEAILEQCKILCGQLKYDYVFMPVSSLFLHPISLHLSVFRCLSVCLSASIGLMTVCPSSCLLILPIVVSLFVFNVCQGIHTSISVCQYVCLSILFPCLSVCLYVFCLHTHVSVFHACPPVCHQIFPFQPCAALDSRLVDALEQFLLCEVLQEEVRPSNMLRLGF